MKQDLDQAGKNSRQLVNWIFFLAEDEPETLAGLTEPAEDENFML